MHVEIVRFTAGEEQAAGLLAERREMIEAVRERFPALRSARLTRVDATTWYDLVVWDDLEQAQRAAAELATIPAAAAWASRIGEVQAIEHAEVVHELAPGAGSGG